MSSPTFLWHGSRLSLLLAAALALAACGERHERQEAREHGAKGSEASERAHRRGGDRPEWAGVVESNAYLAPGYTPGSEAALTAQLRRRAQAQNESVRIGS